MEPPPFPQIGMLPMFRTFYDECRRCKRLHLIVAHISEDVDLLLCFDCWIDVQTSAWDADPNRSIMKSRSASTSE